MQYDGLQCMQLIVTCKQESQGYHYINHILSYNEIEAKPNYLVTLF